MFGPNKYSTLASDESYHHRTKTFMSLMEKLESTFKYKFSISDDYEIIFLSGCGTMANEAVMSSLNSNIYVENRGQEFSERLVKLAINHKKLASCAADSNTIATVLYDTASSKLNQRIAFGTDKLVFADMISAFPYYMPTGNIDIWTTVGSKQIGALPIISIVVMSKKATKSLRKNFYSCLNLYEALFYKKLKQTPHSPAIPLFENLLKTIEKYDRKKEKETIDFRRGMLEAVIPPEWQMGEGPVFTFKKNAIFDRIIKSYNLYVGSEGPQLFLWTGEDRQYEWFLNDIRKLI